MLIYREAPPRLTAGVLLSTNHYFREDRQYSCSFRAQPELFASLRPATYSCGLNANGLARAETRERLRDEADVLAFTASVLQEFEGRQEDSVTLEALSPGQGRVRCTDAGVQRVLDFGATDPGSGPPFPPTPEKWASMPAEFLTALDEAARTTANESTRFALARIQLRGKGGQVVGTDGKQLLLHSGFDFPWTDDVLLPRVSAIGSSEMRSAGAVRMGRTEKHVVVGVGPWTFHLTLDATSRFPDVQCVIPRSSAHASRLTLHPQDAAFLTHTLPKLPGSDDDRSLTLDLDRRICVRVPGQGSSMATEIELSRSTAAGRPLRFCCVRDHLLRALKLGFRELQLTAAESPILFKEERRLYLAMPVAPSSALAPAAETMRLDSASSGPPPETPPIERSQPIMSVPRTNGHAAEDPLSSTPAPAESLGTAEVITEAEGLRTLLQEAGGRLTRLITALKLQRKQHRTFRAAMESLRQLQHLAP